MHGRWLNLEHNQSEQAIVGRAWWSGMTSPPVHPQMMHGVKAKYLERAVLCLGLWLCC